MIDTDVAIRWRDGQTETRTRILAWESRPVLSLVSLVELYGGQATGAHGERRRARLEAILRAIDVLPFDRSIVDTYASILSAKGFSRARILDRLIAATAIVHDLTLVTINGADFRDIPDLKLEVWPAPG